MGIHHEHSFAAVRALRASSQASRAAVSGVRRPMRFVAEIEGASHERSFLRITQFYHLFDKNR